MAIVHAFLDAEVTERERRLSLFSGNLFVYSPRHSTLALSAATRMLIENALGPEPAWAQQRLSDKEFATRFEVAARSFSRNAIELVSATAADFGCDMETTFVGQPFLVATTGLDFLAHGVGVPHHPHRDTWYAASPCQVNWWVPLYDLDSSAAFAFYPSYWDVPLHNNSRDFHYEGWHQASQSGMLLGGAEVLSLPRPLDPIELTPEIRIKCPAGGVIVSSAAQLYSAVPNETSKTYFSVHFQTASAFDLETGVGAEDLDGEAEGTALSTFVRCSDLRPIPRELVQRELARRTESLRPRWRS